MKKQLWTIIPFLSLLASSLAMAADLKADTHKEFRNMAMAGTVCTLGAGLARAMPAFIRTPIIASCAIVAGTGTTGWLLTREAPESSTKLAKAQISEGAVSVPSAASSASAK